MNINMLFIIEKLYGKEGLKDFFNGQNIVLNYLLPSYFSFQINNSKRIPTIPISYMLGKKLSDQEISSGIILLAGLEGVVCLNLVSLVDIGL